MLAVRAVVAGSPRLPELSDECAATHARLTFALVNLVGQLETAMTAIGMHIVTQGAATGFDRFGQGVPDVFQQETTSLPANPVGRALGGDAGAKKAFGRVNIADSDQQVVVHQRRFDRPASFGE